MIITLCSISGCLSKKFNPKTKKKKKKICCRNAFHLNGSKGCCVGKKPLFLLFLCACAHHQQCSQALRCQFWRRISFFLCLSWQCQIYCGHSRSKIVNHSKAAFVGLYFTIFHKVTVYLTATSISSVLLCWLSCLFFYLYTIYFFYYRKTIFFS